LKRNHVTRVICVSRFLEKSSSAATMEQAVDAIVPPAACYNPTTILR
jgi:hypothetical protein